jgi:hypothetical protein
MDLSKNPYPHLEQVQINSFFTPQDHIARAKVTFCYTENGSKGLLKNKKAYIAFSSGGK